MMTIHATRLFSSIVVAELMLPPSLDGEPWAATPIFFSFSPVLSDQGKLPSLGPEPDWIVEPLSSGEAEPSSRWFFLVPKPDFISHTSQDSALCSWIH